MTAVSGGVTLCVEERTLDDSDRPESGPLFCDLGFTAVIDPSFVHSSRPDLYTEALGLKGYLTPQSESITAMHNLNLWLETADRYQLPLILDAAVLDNKTLFMASPCRMMSIQQRIEAEDFSDVFGGAFVEDEVVDSEEEEEDLTPEQKDKKRGERSYTSPKLDARRVESRQITIGHPSCQPEGAYKTIYVALEEKINEDEGKMETLVSAEVAAYRGMGRTVFRGTKLQRGLSENSTLSDNPKSKKRPNPIKLQKIEAQPDANSVYLLQLALYPPNSELKGVKRILKAIKSTPCKVHICNLGSANAIAYIRKAKEEEKTQITCETCPHFLYFTDLSVVQGDTRLKNSPPIRNKTNCNFLWELVTMNTVDAVCSQHIPIPPEFKFRPNFRKALPGICGLGCTLQVLWTLLKRPFTDMSTFEHYLVRMAKWTAANPAKILGLTNRGAIKKGFLADLIVWDPFQAFVMERNYSQQKSQCPYLGETLYGEVKKVLIRGNLAYDQGSFYPVGGVVGRN